jgi:hypothetical protein
MKNKQKEWHRATKPFFFENRIIFHQRSTPHYKIYDVYLPTVFAAMNNTVLTLSVISLEGSIHEKIIGAQIPSP